MLLPRPPEADELRTRMREIRGRLPDDVQGIVSGARELADWRHYVRTFPWGSVAAALAAGYFVVPRRIEVMRPDVETLERLAKRQKLVVEPRSRVQEKPGLMESAVNIAGNMILRAGLAYAGQMVGGFLGRPADRSPPREHVP